MEVIIAPDADAVAEIAADVFESYIREGKTLGLATGSTPLELYKKLIERHENKDLSFAKCRAFLLDEYVGLPRTHPESYYKFIRDNFTSHIDIDDSLVKSPDGLADNPIEAGKAYDKAIKDAGGVDIQLLGIGTDGHIGFNEPGSSLSSRTRLKTLHPQTIKDNARFFEGDEDKVPHHVLTQGLGTISEAGHLLLLATGQGKAHAVAMTVEGPVAAVCPASILQFHPHATLICDEPAGSELKLSQYYRYAYEHKPSYQKI